MGSAIPNKPVGCNAAPLTLALFPSFEWALASLKLYESADCSGTPLKVPLLFR